MTPLNCIGKVQFVAAINQDRELSNAAKVIAATLVCHFHNTVTGRCFPTLEQLAEAAAMCRRSVCAAVKELKRTGWIRGKFGGGRGRANEIDLAIERVRSTAPFEATDDVKSAKIGIETVHSNAPQPMKEPMKREAPSQSSLLPAGREPIPGKKKPKKENEPNPVFVAGGPLPDDWRDAAAAARAAAGVLEIDLKAPWVKFSLGWQAKPATRNLKRDWCKLWSAYAVAEWSRAATPKQPAAAARMSRKTAPAAPRGREIPPSDISTMSAGREAINVAA